MPISLAIIVCGCGLIYFGILGFTEKGIRFSARQRLFGKSGKIVGTICIIGGIALVLLGIGGVTLILFGKWWR